MPIVMQDDDANERALFTLRIPQYAERSAMHTCHRKLAAALLCAFCFAATPARGQTGPVFTTEAMLQSPETAAEIESFWSQFGGDKPPKFVGQRGLELAYMVFRQPDQAAEKGAIVISSGRTESFLKYKELIYDLWRNGYSVYIHDHRGQGLSDREAVTAATRQKGHVEAFSDYVEDLRTFVRTRVLAGGHKSLFLLGHSMGGAIAARLLESDGADVQSMFQAAVLSSPMLKIKGIAGLPADTVSCRIGKAELARGKGTDYVKLGSGYKPKEFAKNQYTGSPVRYARLLAQYQSEPTIQLGSPTVGWFARACDAAFQARTEAAGIKTPLLVILAGKDQIVHRSGGEEFCASLRESSPSAAGCDGGGPVTIAGAQHELFIESDDKRNEALKRTLGFFDSRRSP